MEHVKKFLHVGATIGQGAFGRVLLTSAIQNQNQGLPTPPKHKSSTQVINYALKCVHPILKPQRLCSELRFLRDLGGSCNVVQLHTAYFQQGSLFIVMELIEHDRFINYVADLDYGEIRLYMKNLLVALEHIHKYDVMHRDIKPANFLFDRKNKKFLLVDFGLAQKVRTKPGANKITTTSSMLTAHTSTNPLAPSSTPTTPTSTGITRRSIVAPFSEQHHETKQQHHHHHQQIKNGTSFVANINSPQINLSCHFINLPPNSSPKVPNVPTKRHLPEVQNTNDFSQMLKRLAVSTNDESKEPVRLTVGAYESPVTCNDNASKRNVIHQNHKFSTPTVPSRRVPGPKCGCRGKARTCQTCIARPEPIASKSGTPGFKAPEVLLRSPNQNQAIDIWSAGHIFACLLSGHTPFFRDVDDCSALAEIMTISGSQKVIDAARKIGVNLVVQPRREPCDLARLCTGIRSSNKEKRQLVIPRQAFDLLESMLDPNPRTRITASDALRHPWFYLEPVCGHGEN